MPPSPCDHLAANVRAIREARGLSQQQIAKQAGVPRATWSHLELGAANPTLAVLTRVADALQVRLDASWPRRGLRRAICARPSADPPARRGPDSGKLLPEPLPGLRPRAPGPAAGRAHVRRAPHAPGTREYLACERGVVVAFVAGETYRLEVGDVVVFRGDQRHGYHNPGREDAVAYSAIAFVPLAG